MLMSAGAKGRAMYMKWRGKAYANPSKEHQDELADASKLIFQGAQSL